ncbi:SDR family oxidoreductase [Salinicola peritrichatus]|uniref:SDR family oxidoreductase n=1 Tax=Salinicola peritrichatus TaxID=1267424 RepID=UPI000DA18D29|nr:SDR family oxidoreductase [Salinicola peritrichatus]
MSLLSQMLPPEGLHVLISAGASGIGAALAEAFIEAGAKVHICDVNEQAIGEFIAKNPSVVATHADVSDAAAIAQVFAEQQRIGGLDVLVNNAGIAGPTAGIDAIDDTDWQATIDINLSAQYRFAHHAVPMLKASAHGQMLCMSSVAGRLGYAWRTPYAATKWGVVGLMKSLAAELGPDDVRVNALLPGIVEGPRMNGVIRDRAKQAGVPEEQMTAEYLNKISLRRMVTANDVAAMALFLCSPAARNITGQAISIDGNVEYL